MATDNTGYADPTAWTAIANVDGERAAIDGLNPDAALHAADTYLPPTEYAMAEIERTSYMRDEHGHRESVAPWYDPTWHKRRRARPLNNTELADMIAALAPRLAA